MVAPSVSRLVGRLGKNRTVPAEPDAETSFEFPLARTPAERIGEAMSVRFGRVSWAPPEIVPAALVAAVLLFVLSRIVAAVVIGVSGGLDGVAAPLGVATSWAEPVLAAALLGSVLLSWNEVIACCDDLDFFSSSDDDLVADEINPDETIARLCRSRFLASAALVAAGLATAAAIGTEVAVAMEELPRQVNASLVEGVLDAQTWGALIEQGGIALAVAVLALACLIIVLRLRRRARAALQVSESEVADDRGLVDE